MNKEKKSVEYVPINFKIGFSANNAQDLNEIKVGRQSGNRIHDNKKIILFMKLVNN